MEPFKSRFPARVIAIIDLILSSISLISPILIFTVLMAVSVIEPSDSDVRQLQNQIDANLDAHNDITAKQVTKLTLVILWVAFVISTFFVILGLVAAAKLYNATEMVTTIGEPVGCVKKARFWYIVNIVFQVFSFIGIFIYLAYPVSLALNIIGFIFRFVGIFFVRRFIAEIEVSVLNTLPTTNNQGQVQMGTDITYNYSPPSYDNAAKL